MVRPDASTLSARERETRLVVFDDPQFDRHDPGWGHPECPERLPAIRAALQRHGWPVRPGRPVTRAELERVHRSAYIDHVMSAAGKTLYLDPDTGVSPGSVDAALLAAGAAVEAAEVTMAGRNCLVTCRPPGHHATPGEAMGFCLFNNAAVAAAHLEHLGYRVAVVDPDCHHGNGTQEAFWEDPGVLYVSWHRYPFYPGSGAAEEIGGGEGLGATLNVPLPAGSGDAVYLGSLQAVVLPALERFRPEVVVISAGFDQMEGDLLGGMELTREGLAVIFGALASRWPCVAVLEGGYNTRRLGGDVEVAALALAGGPIPDVQISLDPRWVERFATWPHPLLQR
ncbi:MAG: histone deacetylase [Pseudomonadota bacterium]